jgi:hypothetical protein
MDYVVDIVSALAWPALIAFLLWGLTTKRGRLAAERVLGPMRRVKAFGVELELGEEEGRRIKATLEEEFEEFREQVEAEFDRQADQFDVGRLFAGVAEDVIEPLMGEGKQKYRCTIYVPDIVFKDVLYRLLDYYPGGDGRGSTYSARFGIIGRTWRLGESQFEKDVPGDRKTLITEWGMNREEAAGQESKTFVTSLLSPKPGNPSVGLLYIEAEEGAFGEDPLAAIDAHPSVADLTSAVAKVMEEMRGSGPRLELFKN